MTRVNKSYYVRIDRTMAALPQPTIGDAVEAMRAMGNVHYFEQLPHLKREGLEQRFTRLEPYSHEIAHLCAQLGHTPQQEQWTPAFNVGFKHGLYAGKAEAQEIAAIHRQIVNTGEKYKTLETGLTGKTILPASPRQNAVNLAAGMYLREKFEEFYRQGMQGKSYAAQRDFAQTYEAHDHRPASHPASRALYLAADDNYGNKAPYHDWIVGEELPYAMVKLSPGEWKAITGVALGLRTPEETPYAERLKPIQRALEHVGLAHDMRGWAERLQANTPEMRER